MRNMLQDTLFDIAESGHEPPDIVFIGNRERTYSLGYWSQFSKAINRDYDPNGYHTLASDLVIVFNDHSLLYRESDEDERAGWWEYLPGDTEEQAAEIPVEAAWSDDGATSLVNNYQKLIAAKAAEDTKKKLAALNK